MKTLLCTLLLLSSVYAEHNERHNDNARDLFIGLETAILVDKLINREPQYAPRYIEPRQEVIVIDRRPMPPRYYRDEFGVLREIRR